MKQFQNQGPPYIGSWQGDAPKNEISASRKLTEKFNRLLGSKNAGKIMVTSQQIDWTKLGMSAVDLNVLASQSKSLHQLCNAVNVPPILLDPTITNVYKNRDQAMKDLYTEAALPELKHFLTEFNRWIMSSYGDGLWLDYDISGIEVLQQNLKDITDALKLADWLTDNEKRSRMNLPRYEDEDADKLWKPMNLIPLGEDNDEN